MAISGKDVSSAIPDNNYISIMRPLTNDEGVSLITDEQGMPISLDGGHLTRYGAILVGRGIISKTLLHSLLASANTVNEWVAEQPKEA